MRRNLGFPLVLLLAIVSTGGTMAQTQTPEQKIWTLLDDSEAAYVSLGEAEFRALGAGFDLPDGGRSITRLAEQAPGGAFDPRDVAKLAPQQLGYKADWVVERFRRYNLDWDITGLRLESLDPEAKNYPWFIVMNGGAANLYEFLVDLKNRPGWTQYLAQKLNVMIVTIPGNFKYGGWEQPVADAKRQPAYLLDRDLSMDEYEVRNAIFTNSLIMQGLKALVTKHTSGDILLIGHSTSGELSMLAYEDPELSARLKGRYLGWGSGGPARLELLRTVRGKEVADRAGASPSGGRTPLYILERRDPPSYARGLQRLSQSALRARHVAPSDRRALARGGGAPASQFQAAAPEFRAWRRSRPEGVGRERNRSLAQAHRQSVAHLGSRMSRRICLSPISPAWTDFAAWSGRRRISTAITGIRNSP